MKLEPTYIVIKPYGYWGLKKGDILSYEKNDERKKVHNMTFYKFIVKDRKPYDLHLEETYLARREIKQYLIPLTKMSKLLFL